MAHPAFIRAYAARFAPGGFFWSAQASLPYVESMKTILTILLLAATMFASDANVAGKWQISMDTPHGLMQGPLTIEQFGSKLTAKIELEHLGTLNMVGKIEGSNVVFELQNRSDVSLKLDGTLNGGKMSGKMSPQGGEWSATRQ